MPIEISKLRPEDVGRGVVYCPGHGKREDGVIVRWTNEIVFVRYRGQETPAATYPRDLDFLGGPDAE